MSVVRGLSLGCASRSSVSPVRPSDHPTIHPVPNRSSVLSAEYYELDSVSLKASLSPPLSRPVSRSHRASSLLPSPSPSSTMVSTARVRAVTKQVCCTPQMRRIVYESPKGPPQRVAKPPSLSLTLSLLACSSVSPPSPLSMFCHPPGASDVRPLVMLSGLVYG